jgi:ribosomal protein S12 methylthiotransferase accessory factor YcaO
MTRKRLPTIPELVERDVKGFERAWWTQQKLADAGMSLAQVVLEYQFAICAHIVQRLRDPGTPQEVKDAFAMRGLPNLGVVLKSPAADVMAALTTGGQPALAAPTPEAAGPAAPNVSSVLEAYRTTGKLPQ